MSDTLAEICARKREHIAAARQHLPLRELEQRALQATGA